MYVYLYLIFPTVFIIFILAKNINLLRKKQHIFVEKDPDSVGKKECGSGYKKQGASSYLDGVLEPGPLQPEAVQLLEQLLFGCHLHPLVLLHLH